MGAEGIGFVSSGFVFSWLCIGFGPVPETDIEATNETDSMNYR
jgi:hypothetical protein